MREKVCTKEKKVEGALSETKLKEWRKAWEKRARDQDSDLC